MPNLSTKGRYRAYLSLVPKLRNLLGDGVLVTKASSDRPPSSADPIVRSASDFSYSAKEFQMVVLSIYEHIRGTKLDVLDDVNEHDFNKLFSMLHPLIQGSSDMGVQKSKGEIGKALDLCRKILSPITPEQKAHTMQRGLPSEVFDPSAPLVDPETIATMLEGVYGSNGTAEMCDAEENEDTKLVMEHVNARWLLHEEYTANCLELEDIDGHTSQILVDPGLCGIEWTASGLPSNERATSIASFFSSGPVILPRSMSGEAQLEALLDIINSSARQAMAEYKKRGNGVPTINSTEFHPLDSAADTVALRKALRLLEGACQQLCASLAPPRIRSLTGKLARILRLLASKGCFTEAAKDVFVNNRLSLVLKSTNNTGIYIRMLAENATRGIDILFNETLIGTERTTFFDTLMSDDFHKAMVGTGEAFGMQSILHNYPWNEMNSVCDVGSSIGTFTIPLAKTYPHLKITNQDFEDVMTKARGVWKEEAPEALVEGRISFVPLNFLKEAPVAAQDIYYLRQIIHDWPDADASVILRNVRKAMATISRVLVHDYIVISASRWDDEYKGLDVAPEPMLPNFGAGNSRLYQQDLLMWTVQDAKERTLEDSIVLADAGLHFEKVYDLGQTAVLEFTAA
ncbi:hypothetical protein ID866_9521 [Astraeus odoratus]|nr:hypothetical protein ID866_9521 [Astraeus odoratus]